MATVDQPLMDLDNQMDVPTFDNPRESVVEPEVTMRRRQMEAAVINSLSDGSEDFVNTYQRTQMDAQAEMMTGDDIRRMATANAVDEAINAYVNFGQETISARPDLAQQVVEGVSEATDNLRVAGERNDAPYQVLTKALQDPTVVSEEARSELAVRQSLADEVINILGEQSVWGLVGDFALDLVPFKFLVDVVQASDTFNPLEWEGNIRQMISDFQLLTPEEKEDRFPIIKEELLDNLPRFRAAAILQAMIDPTSEEAVAFEFGPLAQFDAAVMAAGMIRIAARTKNIVQLSAASGNKDTASRLNNTVLVDETGDMEEVVGVSKDTAYTNSQPFLADGFDPRSDATIGATVFNSLSDFQRLRDETLDSLERGQDFIGAGLVDDVDIPQAINRIEAEFDAHVQKLRDSDKVQEIKGIKQTETMQGVEFEFTVVDPEGKTTKGTFKRPFVLDDNGFWKQLPRSGPISWFLGSPKARAKNSDFQGAVNTAIRLDFANAVTAERLDKLLGAAMRPITRLSNLGKRKQKIRELDEVLLYGDETENVFTVNELRTGTAGYDLDDDQIAAYYNVRALLDGIASIRNNAARRQMDGRGVKTIFSQGEAVGFGAVEETADAATNAVRNRGIREVFDADTGEYIDADLDFNDWYAEGYRLVRMEDDVLRDGRMFRHVLVKEDGVRSLPQQVLDQKRGYIPRVNHKAGHFVQVIQDVAVDGVLTPQRRVVRGFDNEREANAFAEEFRQAVADGSTDFSDNVRLTDEGEEVAKFSTRAKVVVNQENEVEQFRVGASDMTAARGLIYGPRRSEAVPFGRPEDELESARLGAFPSIGLYLHNSRNFINRNEWRMGLRRKWENTARRLTGNDQITFENPQASLENAALKEAYDQINRWSGFLTPTERTWDLMVQKAYETVLPYMGRNGFTSRLHALKHNDPIAFAKTLAFHSLLGALNPVQLLVQGSGAAVAASMSLARPDKLALHLTRQNALGLLQHGNAESFPKIYKGIAASGGYSVDEMRKVKSLWDKTGLYDSTLSNADVDAAQAGFGVSSEMWRRVQNGSIFFFRQGELFNRRLSFLTAVDELGGVDAVAASPQLQRQMMTRVSDLLLNLNRANRSWWQEGVFSIPTQFRQIITKTAETMFNFNGAFSKADRIKMGIGQFALYGSAGIPFGQWMSRKVLDAQGVDRLDIDDPDNAAGVTALTGGATDWLFQQYLGADVVASDRLALMNGLDQAIKGFTTGETTPLELFGGPFVGATGRFFDRFAMVTPYLNQYSFDDFSDMSVDDMLDAAGYLFEDAGDLLLGTSATGNQITRYNQMKTLNALLDRRGNAITIQDFDKRTELAALFGLKPADLQRKYNIQEENSRTEETIDDYVDLMMHAENRTWMKYARERNEGKSGVDHDSAKRDKNTVRLILASIPDEEMRQIVWRRFGERLERRRLGQDQLSRQIEEARRLYIQDLAGDMQGLFATPVTPLN